jgi:protocatechuate 3,4-dioxygenase, alpha subunit
MSGTFSPKAGTFSPQTRHVQTPSQTIGPFFDYALPYEFGPYLVGENTDGERITIEGRITDGDGQPVTDALVEIWQANSHGGYRHPEDTREEKELDQGFDGFGRAPTDAHGVFRFTTVKPGPVPGLGNHMQAPHVNIGILARGLLKRLATRLYFADEAAMNAADPVLNLVPSERRGTLIADRLGDKAVYRLDIVLQGANETVFFDI